MCDCKSKVISKVSEKLQEQPGHIASEVSFKHEAFRLGNGGISAVMLYLPIEYILSFPKKNGSMSKPIKKEINMYPSYCPFCGEKYPEID